MHWPTTLTFVVLFSFISLTLTQEETLRPVIRTTKGEVRGSRTFITNQQIPVDRFLGIPYAQPPVGQGRFRRPLEAQAWSSVREVTQYPAACYQTVKHTGFRGDDMWNPTVPLSEDCLYLNVWVPRNIQRPMRKLTTLVWVYGGGFSSGSSDLDLYDGSYVAAIHNVIVVSMNYRVGPFGFLNFGIPEASGNVGLMDQSMALKWTYENIEVFGGDPDKITLFGESAGSASVSYHLLARPSWDYFSNAIMMSGAASCTWAFQSQRKSVTNAKMYANEAGCDSEDAKEMVNCLRQKTPDELTSAAANLSHFRPTVDGSFITKSPEKLLKSKDFKRCNIVLGFTSNEQSYFMSMSDKRFDRSNTEEPSVRIPEMGNLVNKLTLADSPILPNSSVAYGHLTQVYVHGIPKKRRDSNFKVLEAMVGDHDFKCPIIKLARAYASEDLDVFLYRFHHISSTSPWPQWMGAMHGYDVEFVFGMPYNTSWGFSADDKRVSDVLLSYFEAFASTGNPNVKRSGIRMWPKFTEADQKYQVLQSGPPETKQYPRFAECSFWTDFVPVLERHAESTALELARCEGTRARSAVPSVLVAVLLSAVLAARNG